MRHTSQPYADQLSELLAAGNQVPVHWGPAGAQPLKSEAWRVRQSASDEFLFALDVLEGLSRQPKSIPSKYLYDAAGSRLFKQITQLDEYYLTRCEHEILQNHCSKLGCLGSAPFNLLELGVGDGHKTAILIQHFLQNSCEFLFVPIDVSEEAVTDAIDSLGANPACEGLLMKGLVTEYADAMNCLAALNNRPNLVLFLGSSIGNFQPPEARRFLHHLWMALKHGDHVLIGFDLCKDVDTIARAYNDTRGLTSQFNLNMLDRINRELNANFNRDAFQFSGQYNVLTRTLESWLISTSRQDVYIDSLRRSFSFQPWEGLHTEWSRKFDEPEIARMAEETGFIVEESFYDANRYFTDSLWRVEKG